MPIRFSDKLFKILARQQIPGYYRLMKFVASSSYPTLMSHTKHGLVFRLDPANYIDSQIIRFGYYEEEVFEALKPYLGGTAVLWDVGANIGLHALTAKKLFPELQVFAFEPAPATLSSLRFNMEENGLVINILELALSSSSGTADFSVLSKRQHGLSSLKPWPGVQYEAVIRCETARAEELIKERRLPLPSVVKIDVEGCELDVLRGFGPSLSYIKAIVFEAQPGFIRGEKQRDLMDFLLSHGFSIESLMPADNNCTNFIARLDRHGIGSNSVQPSMSGITSE